MGRKKDRNVTVALAKLIIAYFCQENNFLYNRTHSCSPSQKFTPHSNRQLLDGDRSE